MTRVLALCSAADVTGSVRQFDLALPLLRERFDVARHALPADVKALIASLQPDLIHTLGAEAFRAVKNASVGAFGRRQKMPKWVAAGAAAVEPAFGLVPGLTATISQCEHERDWAARLTPAPMQFTLPVGITRPVGAPTRGALRCGHPQRVVLRGDHTGGHPQGVPLQDGNHTILAAGGFDQTANLKHAVWAFDALRYAHPSLQLVLLGDGPLRPDVERFTRSLGLASAVRFVGFQTDIEPYFRSASQAWGTHTRGGTKFLLEAMAAGVPVIAYRTPDAERVIRDGATGRLVPVGGPVEVARVAHGLLSSPDRTRALTVAGEAEAARYPVADLARAVAGVYDIVTSSDSPRSE